MDDTRTIMRTVNIGLLFASILFAASTGIVLNQYLHAKGPAIEAMLWPPTEDWTFRDWRQEPDGYWSAQVYVTKTRDECIFVKDQILTVAYLTPEGDLGEAKIEWIDDQTPGNNRPTGWTKLERMVFRSSEIVPGTFLKGSVLHRCHDGLPTVSGFKHVVVGEDMPWPGYVEAWLRSGREGRPSDYR